VIGRPQNVRGSTAAVLHVPTVPDGHRSRRALRAAFALNAALLIAEVVGGIVAGSLALLADAAHQASDVVAIGLAIMALRLAERPPSARHSYGLQRAEVLVALANGVALMAVSGWVFWEAARRLAAPPVVEGAALLWVGAVALVVNGGSALMLLRTGSRTLNIRAVALHLASDGAGSLGAIAAGVAIVTWHAWRADPAISIGIGALVVWAAWRLLRETVHVLVEGTPRGLDLEGVARFLASQDGVDGVHHVHLWNIASDVPAMSAHVLMDGDPSLCSAQGSAELLKSALADAFGIRHATLELECRPCVEPVAVPPVPERIGDRTNHLQVSRGRCGGVASGPVAPVPRFLDPRLSHLTLPHGSWEPVRRIRTSPPQAAPVPHRSGVPGSANSSRSHGAGLR
jgi:cobalt-zinc-cadmium efflux system protein